MSLWAAVTTLNEQKPNASDQSQTDTAPNYQEGTAYLLAIAGAIMRREWVDALARLDVTPTQFKLIMALETAGPLGQRELAELVGIDPRNCGPVIDTLVSRALLARETDSVDRRRRVLHLAGKGNQLARKLESANAATEDALLQCIGPTEYTALREKLLPIIEADGTRG
ncbi:MAG: MarR family winged helix-turn-helix transcriptional regulator [Solirubrobacteraceae bacterium]